MNKISFNAPYTILFVVISFALLCLPVQITEKYFTVWTGANPITYVTHIFGHSNWSHFNNNMRIFILIAPLLENKYGFLKMTLFTIATALVTSLIVTKTGVGLLGASGIVSMLVALGTFTYDKNKGIPFTAFFIFAFFIYGDILRSFTLDNVSQLSHIIGYICGFVFGSLFMDKKEPKSE